MRARYFISVGQEAGSTTQANRGTALAELPYAASRKKFHVFSDQPLNVITRPGIVFIMLGWFQRNPSPEQKDLSIEVDIDKIISTGITDIFNIYWGSYVAILYYENDDKIEIIRDPSGGMPCYYRCSKDGVNIVSDMDLIRKHRILEFIIDYDQIGHHLLFPNFRTNQTCLSELSEVPPGYQLTANCETCALTQKWDPWHFARRDAYYRDPDEAISDLRATVLSTIGAWVSRFQKPVIGLSGGLDSSIVAASAVRAGAEVTGLTLVTDESAGDERHYARQIADFLGISLEERHFSVADADLRSSHAAHLPRPLARSFAQSGDRAYCDVAAQVRADAFFTGAGGDNVFCFQQSVLPIADRILYDGMGRGMCKTTAEIAEMAETSVFRCATLAMRRAWFRNPQYQWRTQPDLLSREFLSQHTEKPSHSWLNMPVGELPGKAAHIAYLLQIQNHLEGFRRENILPQINPLMSQPIVEMCLRIPTWFSCMGGENRSIARRAFAPYLPEAILHRRTKGGPDGFLQQLFLRNRNIIRDMLLGGNLTASNLIDRPAVEAAIMLDGDGNHQQHFRILELVDAEAWISDIRA
jgi:asparagine synthase (glutamine-hydrolysing)